MLNAVEAEKADLHVCVMHSNAFYKSILSWHNYKSVERTLRNASQKIENAAKKAKSDTQKLKKRNKTEDGTLEVPSGAICLDNVL
jgi:hypothetical protein